MAQIHLTDNVENIMTFLDLDLDVYNKGFKTYNDAFDFIIKSKCYNHEYYTSRDYVNSDSWKRDRVRKTYNLFLDYIQGIEKLSEPKKNFNENVRAVHNFFRDLNIKNIIRGLKKEEMVNTKNKRYINGELYKKITGLEGKELGKFVWFIKQDLNETFGDHYYKHKRKMISDFIKNRYKDFLNVIN
jgi:hypothetical protein